jgi:hypothetical protein
MANPNIVNVARIFGNTVAGTFAASNTAFLTNPASSGSVYKINTINVANIDGAANADFSLILRLAGANTIFVETVALPADSVVIAVDKANGFYLNENCTIGGSASAAGDVTYVISFEQLYAT